MMRRILVVLSCLFVAVAGLIAGSSTTGGTPAGAAPGKCADVHVLFARGTAETAPPLGVIGIAFGNSLEKRLPGKSVRVEAVNYAASADFSEKLKFAESFVEGMRTAQRRIKAIAAACPDTKIVLGGYSQGAALIGYTISSEFKIPAKYKQYDRYVPAPLPAELASHIAAVVQFGTPSARFIRDAGAPPIEPQSVYRNRTVRYCIAGDTICNGAPLGGPNGLHLLYPVNGMTDQAANFVARHL
ncbi:cutinase family protein [Gordonia sp. (in: high G+C Gram-positive bacteria)]|uniref:cutinase family protein n=1 Tax=Gordonia sp. (in: high G+C Gram-positive bacteria) TaxID=84139 RepID=UPI003C753BE4